MLFFKLYRKDVWIFSIVSVILCFIHWHPTISNFLLISNFNQIVGYIIVLVVLSGNYKRILRENVVAFTCYFSFIKSFFCDFT